MRPWLAALTPLHIGRNGHQMFACYLEPSAPTRRHAVLLCNPFGQEAIRAQRLYRVLGDRLTAAGFHVLRFDYYGSGDSAGEDEAFDLDGATADTRLAADWLLQRSKAQQLSCIGLRLGATIALLASTSLPQRPTLLGLIDPVLDGPAYLAHLADANERALARTYDARWSVYPRLHAFNLPSPGSEALGFPLTTQFRDQMAQLSNTALKQTHASRLVVLTPQPQRFKADLLAQIPSLEAHTVIFDADSDIDWATDSAVNTAIVPMHWIKRLINNLTECAVDA